MSTPNRKYFPFFIPPPMAHRMHVLLPYCDATKDLVCTDIQWRVMTKGGPSPKGWGEGLICFSTHRNFPYLIDASIHANNNAIIKSTQFVGEIPPASSLSSHPCFTLSHKAIRQEMLLRIVDLTLPFIPAPLTPRPSTDKFEWTIRASSSYGDFPMRRLIQNYTISSSYNLVTSADNANIREAQGTDAFDEFCINLTAGEVRVFGSLDGVTFMAKQLVLCQEPPNTADVITSQAPVYVGKATTNVPAWFYGNYKAIRIQQVGVTQPVGVLSASGQKP